VATVLQINAYIMLLVEKNRIRARTHVKSKKMIAQKRSGTSVV